MTRPALWTACVFLATMCGGRVAPALSAEARQPRTDCGVNALYLLCRLEGRPVTLGQLEAELPPSHPNGLSMAEIIAVADRLGLNLEGVRWDRRDGPLTRPAIAFLQVAAGGHFAVIEPVGATGACVQIIDPPYAPRIIDFSLMTSAPQWTGNLLVARRPWPVRNQWILIGILASCVGFTLANRLLSARRRSDPGVGIESAI